MTESISATSALVLLMGKEYYTDGLAKKFLDSINLDSGADMKKLCDEVWTKYGEIVKNRKDSVYRAISSRDDKKIQVVILAAGFDAQALNVVEKINNALVFEIDMHNMDAKSAKYDNILADDMRKRISTITCDVTSNDLIENLKNAGWDNQKPTIIVMEGISYYLQYEQFWKLVSLFSSEKRHNRIVVDYMIPMHMMDSENSKRMSGVFRIIGELVDLECLTVLESNSMSERIIALGGKNIIRETLHDMELARTGKNVYFDANSRGGIETCAFDI